MQNTIAQGLQYGPDFTHLNDLPLTYKGAVQAPTDIYVQYDDRKFGFAGNWDSDSRVCLQNVSPNPCTILGMTIDMSTE